ncbi:hypothetical protein C8F01DRAFT_1224562 [Mycena amicta]|nr:hypothetical protein C8F01DRAFT_1224562 [Mycena amicta]
MANCHWPQLPLHLPFSSLQAARNRRGWQGARTAYRASGITAPVCPPIQVPPAVCGYYSTNGTVSPSRISWNGGSLWPLRPQLPARLDPKQLGALLRLTWAASDEVHCQMQLGRPQVVVVRGSQVLQSLSRLWPNDTVIIPLPSQLHARPTCVPLATVHVPSPLLSYIPGIFIWFDEPLDDVNGGATGLTRIIDRVVCSQRLKF